MTPRELAPGIHRIVKGFVNAFLVEADDGLTIVDSGLPKGGEVFLRAIRGLGRDATEVRSILITHHHVDHVGSLAALGRATGATVYAPAADAAIIRGESPRPRVNPPSAVGRLTTSLVARFGPEADPAGIDHEVVDGQVLPVAGGIRAIHTPGHTAGQTSYLLPRDGGVLFVGDAAANLMGRLGPPVRGVQSFHTEDLDEARRSFRKLGELEFDVALVGHGSPILSRASERFRAQAV
jgi:glyoxylase-like metal-dependent hydrolase (beta-lactamase superfamily II)